MQRQLQPACPNLLSLLAQTPPPLRSLPDVTDRPRDPVPPSAHCAGSSLRARLSPESLRSPAPCLSRRWRENLRSPLSGPGQGTWPLWAYVFHFIPPKLTRTLTPLRSTATCPIGTPSPPDPAPCSCPRLHPHPPDNSNSLRSSLGDPSRTNHPGSRSSMALRGTQGDTSGPPEGFAGAGSLSRRAGRVPTSPQSPLRPSPGSLSPPEGGLS